MLYIVPIYKKNNKCEKENYRPVRILSNLSKIYEKLIYHQLYEYFVNIIFPSQCDFRKGYNAQHCLLVMIEKFKEAIDIGNEFGALLTNLSKTFNCINHPLLIAKLYNYRVSPLFVNMIFSYLNNRTYGTKINEWFKPYFIFLHKGHTNSNLLIRSLVNFFTGSSIIILKPTLENVISF